VVEIKLVISLKFLLGRISCELKRWVRNRYRSVKLEASNIFKSKGVYFKAMRPVIGISTAWSVETWGDTLEHGGYIYCGSYYIFAVARSNAIPMMVPPVPEETNLQEMAKKVIDLVDGLLLTGGGDAKRFKPEEMPPLKVQQPLRYEFERHLIKEAFGKNLPTLGICRGYQMIAEVLGGSIGESIISGHKQKGPGTQAFHGIKIDPKSKFYEICGIDYWKVNSFHVQAVESPPPGFRVVALSDDGVIEGIEAIDKDFFIGVQFHPEELFPVDQVAQKLFLKFIEAAKVYRNSMKSR